MKNKIRIPAVLAILSLASCEKLDRQAVEIDTPAEVEAKQKSMPDSADAKFKDGMTEKAFQDYLRIRTALVRRDTEEAGRASEDLAEGLGAEHSEILRAATAVGSAEGIDSQRIAFAQLTSELEPILREGLSKGSVHVLHCPMAFDNRGASWLSDSAEIRNPYFGEAMLTCGEVRETITPGMP